LINCHTEILSYLLDEHISGTYTYQPSAHFYKGHFKDYPITPGVILTETMAQIGLVCFGIHLLGDSIGDQAQVAMTSTDIEFYVPVLPGEKVVVHAQKEYFRFHKLKCKVEMKNEQGKLVCRGFISGMLKLGHEK